LYLVCAGSERGGVLCERALLVWARPNIYLDLIYIYCGWLSWGPSVGVWLLSGLDRLFLRKNLFIYLFIFVAFVLSVWVL